MLFKTHSKHILWTWLAHRVKIPAEWRGQRIMRAELDKHVDLGHLGKHGLYASSEYDGVSQIVRPIRIRDQVAPFKGVLWARRGIHRHSG